MVIYCGSWLTRNIFLLSYMPCVSNNVASLTPLCILFLLGSLNFWLITGRKQTSFCWYLLKGSWVSWLCCKACSSTVAWRTEVCTHVIQSVDCHTVSCNLNNLLLFYFFCITPLTVGSDFRRNLPVDLTEGVLRALCLQSLGQVFIFLPSR